MSKVKDDDAVTALADTLLLCAGAGLVSSSLVAMLAATDAFSQRLLNSVEQSTRLSTLQISSLARSLAELQTPRPATTRILSTREDNRLPPGWPVVT